MTIKIVALIFSAGFFLFVVELIRREKLTFKYALSWFLFSLGVFIFTIFDKLLFSIAKAFGFVLPSNFIFFLIGVMFIFVSLIFTVYLCGHNGKIEKLAQKIGLLENELKSFKK